MVPRGLGYHRATRFAVFLVVGPRASPRAKQESTGSIVVKEKYLKPSTARGFGTGRDVNGAPGRWVCVANVSEHSCTDGE